MLPPTTTFFLVAFATLTSAVPTTKNLAERAGGPIAKPIPTSCTVTHPIPTLSPDQGYIPKASTDDALLYSAYYPSPSTDQAALAEQCLQQCYGYGDSTECKGMFWAENVAVPTTYYNSPPGTYSTACLFFTRPLSTADFDISAAGGEGTTAYAANIQC